MSSFPDGAEIGFSSTPVSAENDGTFIYTAMGGSVSGNPLVRYLLDGTLDEILAPGIDFRSLFTNNSGQLFAKEFFDHSPGGQPGNVYSLTPSGEKTFLLTLGEFQSSADFNAADTELFTRDGRYCSAL